MDRKGYYLRPGTRATAPNVIFSVVCSHAIASGGRGSPDHFLTWSGASVCCSKYRRGKWSAVRGAECDTPEQLAAWMAKHSEKHTRNYVFSPNASETLAVAGVWEQLDNGPVKWFPGGTVRDTKAIKRKVPDLALVHRVALSPRVTILDATKNEKRWLWLSGRQYFDQEEEQLARAVGHVWTDSGELSADTSAISRTTKERSLLWLTAFRQLSDWWRANTKAPFGLTASSCSMGVLRSHIRPKVLCTHNNPYVHSLERDACFGGRASTWYYGDVGYPRRYSSAANPAPPPSQYGRIRDTLVQLDVRSMYPWLLRDHAFPVRLFRHTERCDVTELMGYCRSFGVIARVTVETEVPEYPFRTGGRIYYPVGRFTTTMTGPELLRLRQDGKIAKVHSVAVYHLDRPYREAARALIKLREESRESGNLGWELFAKLLGNGLGGKLAQRRGEWRARMHVGAALRFGEWYDVSGTTRARHRYRAIAGLVWEYLPDATGAGPYTASFAYLTALGRLHMRGIRETFPEQAIVSMDTDGLWALADYVDQGAYPHQGTGTVAGSLCIAGTASAGRWLGPRHYYTPAGWVLAGFSSPKVHADGRWVIDSQRLTAISGPAGSAPRGVTLRERLSELAIEAPGVVVGKDGWASPRRRKGLLST